jgi:hypothetical protein
MEFGYFGDISHRAASPHAIKTHRNPGNRPFVPSAVSDNALRFGSDIDTRRPASSGVAVGPVAPSLTFSVARTSLGGPILLWRCGKVKGVKPSALLVAQLFLKLSNGDLDRLHRNPGGVEPSLDYLQAR